MLLMWFMLAVSQPEKNATGCRTFQSERSNLCVFYAFNNEQNPFRICQFPLSKLMHCGLQDSEDVHTDFAAVVSHFNSSATAQTPVFSAAECTRHADSPYVKWNSSTFKILLDICRRLDWLHFHVLLYTWKFVRMLDLVACMDHDTLYVIRVSYWYSLLSNWHQIQVVHALCSQLGAVLCQHHDGTALRLIEGQKCS